jgi:peptide deformylase
MSVKDVIFQLLVISYIGLVRSGYVMIVEDEIVQYNEKDNECLRETSSPVVMRLYVTNPSYREMILTIIRNMQRILNSRFDDYGSPIGISGPNVGIGIRIIIITNSDGSYLPMINPVITKGSRKIRLCNSGCGSVGKINAKVYRSTKITVEYFDMVGIKQVRTFTRMPCYIIQHEVDHLDGILIIDKNERD